MSEAEADPRQQTVARIEDLAKKIFERRVRDDESYPMSARKVARAKEAQLTATVDRVVPMVNRASTYTGTRYRAFTAREEMGESQSPRPQCGCEFCGSTKHRGERCWAKWLEQAPENWEGPTFKAGWDVLRQSCKEAQPPVNCVDWEVRRAALESQAGRGRAGAGSSKAGGYGNRGGYGNQARGPGGGQSSGTGGQGAQRPGAVTARRESEQDAVTLKRVLKAFRACTTNEGEAEAGKDDAPKATGRKEASVDERLDQQKADREEIDTLRVQSDAMRDMQGRMRDDHE